MSENIYKHRIDEVIKRNFIFPDEHPADYWDYDQPYDGSIDTKNLRLIKLSEHSNFLNNLFDHLTASAKNEEQFKKYYCFIKESSNLNKREISAVNYDENTALECLESLVSQSAIGTSAHFLTGKKGSGKTFFINYLLTVHRQLLLDKKVIYVRTSLLKRLDDEMISHRVERQSIKILVEHYFNKGILCIKNFEGFLRNAIPEQLVDGEFCKVLTRDEIMFKVWGTQVVVGDRTIDVHVRKLREKIGEKYIKTIKGVGYKFKA